MGPVRATFFRTLGRAIGLPQTAFAAAAFLSVSAVVFFHVLDAAEGGMLSAPVLWATSLAPVFPVLVALFGMDVWSGERASGRVDLLLTVAVRERDYVFGKFLAVFFLSLMAVLLSLVSTLTVLRLFAPTALTNVRLLSFLPAVLALAVQGTLWSAVAVMTSSLFRSAATAAAAAVVLLVVLPRGLWSGLMACSPAGRTAFGELPLDAHVVDIASGLVPLGTTASYVILAVLALFISAMCVAALRLVGRGARVLRASTAVAVFLAVLLGFLSTAMFARVNPTAEVLVSGRSDELSLRTQSVLAETSGTISITAFFSRTDAAMRPVSRLLRSLKRLSESVGGARIDLRFVDPRWDIGTAERLVRRGAVEQSVVIEKGRRLVSLPVGNGVSERLCASTIRRVCTPQRRHAVYWTVGHGESLFDDYGSFGMSEIARDLFREGFSNKTIDLAADAAIPADCALILVSGAQDDFSRPEADRLNAYLREGGRLLVLLGSARAGGIVSLLPTWGLRPTERPIENVRTLSGSDVLVSDFTDHAITATLGASRIVLDRPVSFEPSAAADSGTGADRISYTSVASAGSVAVVSATERGVGAGEDLALRPTRVVAIGDSSFVMNGQLSARASANRDFFLNCVAWLSGEDAVGSGESEGVFSSGMDRTSRTRGILLSAVGVPAAVFLILSAVAWRRRRRS